MARCADCGRSRVDRGDRALFNAQVRRWERAKRKALTHRVKASILKIGIYPRTETPENDSTASPRTG